MRLLCGSQFVYHQSMPVERSSDRGVSRIASAIGDPSRARMLCCLMDDHARTAAELAIAAGISASTASVHLGRLKEERLVKVLRQGKHHYYTLGSAQVAAILESLVVLSGAPKEKFVPNTPNHLRAARTCYDHIAGTLGVTLHDRMLKLNWISNHAPSGSDSRTLTPSGEKAFGTLGIDIEHIRSLRRQFASPCLDWSERRPHLGGAIGAALLTVALKKKWVRPHVGSRALSVTARGRREILRHFAVNV